MKLYAVCSLFLFLCLVSCAKKEMSPEKEIKDRAFVSVFYSQTKNLPVGFRTEISMLQDADFILPNLNMQYFAVNPGEVTYSIGNIQGRFTAKKDSMYTIILRDENTFVTRGDLTLSDEKKQLDLRWILSGEQDIKQYSVDIETNQGWQSLSHAKFVRLGSTEFLRVKVMRNGDDDVLYEGNVNIKPHQYIQDITLGIFVRTNGEVFIDVMPHLYMYFGDVMPN